MNLPAGIISELMAVLFLPFVTSYPAPFDEGHRDPGETALCPESVRGGW
jgi:hypothetical protein